MNIDLKYAGVPSVNKGLDNGSLHDGTKPLPEPMLWTAPPSVVTIHSVPVGNTQIISTLSNNAPYVVFSSH